MLKRLFDVTAAAAGLFFLGPLLLLIAAIVKLDSRGPVFYRGRRTGLHGRPFFIYKFRTMVPDAELRGSTATAHRDPRITRVGHLLRKYKLDEFPQLLNVLNGDMSIVGPRPEVEEHTSVYTPEEQVILTVRPGITDYSSIRFVNLGELLGSDDPNRVFIEKYRSEKNRLRIEYVQKQSFLEDLRIIFRTLMTVFGRR
ncbi:MAG TPA: sugar transferase [Thermoanaerobaculia bacterium]|nr:sugar transferase [Thermoanaerobaculia bacterium]